MTQIINIKCTNGDKFVVDAELEQTVADLKSQIEGQITVPSDQQRLIYKGHVLQDGRTLSSYSIEGGQTVILVRGSKPRAEAPSQPASSPAAAAAASPAAPAAAAPAFAMPSGMGQTGAAGPASANSFPAFFPSAGLDFAQMQQQLMSNPEQMQAIMNSPMMQSLMENPEMIQNIFQSNPQFRQIFDQNPELAQVLNDPEMIRQSMQMAANPNLMREMMRTNDRAMSNIEAHPEGFNALRRLYENVQEPMMEAAAEINRPPISSTQPRQSPTVSNSPNTAPLPNPWAPSANSQGNAAMPDMSGLMNAFMQQQNQQGASGPAANPFGGYMPQMSPEMMSQMMQNPAFMQMMQQMLSDPAQMQAVINANPLMRQMMESNPAMASMMSNPALLQSMANPAVIQSILQMSQGANTGAAAAQPPNPFSSFFMPPAATNAARAPASGVQPEILYRDQLSQLNDMGFTDAAANLAALLATGGNVQAAIDRLLQG